MHSCNSKWPHSGANSVTSPACFGQTDLARHPYQVAICTRDAVPGGDETYGILCGDLAQPAANPDDDLYAIDGWEDAIFCGDGFDDTWKESWDWVPFPEDCEW